MRKSGTGFSLYELLVTVAVTAVVLSVGVPSLGILVARNRQQVEINALFHAIYAARKESITKRRVVSLCPSTDGATCRPGLDWSSGWILFVNDDRDSPPRIDPGEAVLQYHRSDESIRLRANRKGFTSRGTWLRTTNGTIVACDIGERVAPKALVISYTGRPRVALRTPAGDAYECAD